MLSQVVLVKQLLFAVLLGIYWVALFKPQLCSLDALASQLVKLQVCCKDLVLYFLCPAIRRVSKSHSLTVVRQRKICMTLRKIYRFSCAKNKKTKLFYTFFLHVSHILSDF